MYCPSCGKENTEDCLYCFSCGGSMDGSTPGVAVVTTTVSDAFCFRDIITRPSVFFSAAKKSTGWGSSIGFFTLVILVSFILGQAGSYTIIRLAPKIAESIGSIGGVPSEVFSQKFHFPPLMTFGTSTLFLLIFQFFSSWLGAFIVLFIAGGSYYLLIRLFGGGGGAMAFIRLLPFTLLPRLAASILSLAALAIFFSTLISEGPGMGPLFILVILIAFFSTASFIWNKFLLYHLIYQNHDLSSGRTFGIIITMIVLKMLLWILLVGIMVVFGMVIYQFILSGHPPHGRMI